MNQYELPAFIADKFPETKKEISWLSVIGNANHAMDRFAVFMRNNIVTHQFSKVFNCLQLADYLWVHGNPAVKDAVENAFVYSFSRASQSCNKKEWELIKTHMPPRLYSMYIKQVIGYGS